EPSRRHCGGGPTTPGHSTTNKRIIMKRRLHDVFERFRAASMLAAAACVSTLVHADEVHTDLVYATAGDTQLKLDLYLPDGVETPPLTVWIHGGAWQFGSKENPPSRFAESGFALASVEFRQSTEAPFPAMIHDLKAAVRFLRANAA